MLDKKIPCGYVASMSTLHHIIRRLSQDDAVEYITETVRDNVKMGRRHLARKLCRDFHFCDPGGKTRTNHCLKALRTLEEKGLVCLKVKGKRLWTEVPKPQEVPERVEQVRGLRLVQVENAEQERVWNELIIREHPLGMGWTGGRRLCYLVESEHGLLGAIGFAPSALHLADREDWIGWNRTQKRIYLERVLNMGRFLIREDAACRNLASRVLSMAVSEFPSDFEGKYGFKPWLLETFVDLSHYNGACYQAANWVRVGQTQGRGRQDRLKAADKSVKAIYMYELEPDFRKLMELDRDAGKGAMSVADDVDSENWARKEFGHAELGDKRLTKRLVKLAGARSEKPDKAWAEILGKNWSESMGYYRFVEYPDTNAVNMDTILAPHRERTIQRMKACHTVLCIQDTVDLDYSKNRSCTGLGVIGKNQTRTESRGLKLHSTFTVDSAGTPLGILNAQCYAPELKPQHSGKDARYIPVEEKETYRWIQAQQDVAAVGSELPNVRVINITDREGDFYEDFHAWHSGGGGAELLIRAQHNRSVEGSEKMFDAVKDTPVQGRMRIHMQSRSKRPKKGRRPARPPRSRRDADVDIRYMPTTIYPPKHGLSSKKPPVEIFLIHVHEPHPPQNAEDPIDWYLLTTISLKKPEDAEKCVRWYCKRWRIEDWHRVLKSGCRVEDSRLETADRLKREIAISMVVAWRIMLMTLMSREVPELPADVLFTELEIETLRCYAKKKALKEPENLGEVVELMARLGGYLGRRNDPPPGHLTLCKGYQVLQLLCEGVQLSGIRAGPDEEKTQHRSG